MYIVNIIIIGVKMKLQMEKKLEEFNVGIRRAKRAQIRKDIKNRWADL